VTEASPLHAEVEFEVEAPEARPPASGSLLQWRPSPRRLAAAEAPAARQSKPKKSKHASKQPADQSKAPKWPDHLRGHTIVFAGDSNDRQFVRLVCGWHGADLKRLPESDVGENPWNTSVLIFPSMSQSTYCKIKDKDIILANVVHFGVMWEEPWYMTFLQREEELRLPEVPWKGLGYRRRVWASPGQFPELIWPGVMQKISKMPPTSGQSQPRPTIFFLQSSLWDAVPFSEMEQAKPHELERQFYNMSWRRRASHLVDSVKHHFPGLKQLVWRTTPGCPADNDVVRRLLELQNQETARAISEAGGNIGRFEGNQLAEATRWHGVKLLDWAAEYNVTGKEMCDGAHYPSQGYRALQNAMFGLLGKLH
jgi:hypothetical protein